MNSLPAATSRDCASPPVCVIGLDGATFDILDPWLDAGDMPNLASLVERGARGPLFSTVPPVTGPAWTSMTTGVNPGKHGIIDFIKWDASGVDSRVVRSDDVAVRRVWDRAGDAGLRVCLYNVPITYPAQPVNGVMVTGLPTPMPGPRMTHPRSLFGELKRRGMVPPAVWLFDNSARRYVERHTEAHLIGRRQLEFLLQQFHPDFFFGVFMDFDHLQHRLWSYCDLRAPVEDPVLRQLVRRNVHAIDDSVGLLCRHFGADAHYFVVSDHGFGPLRGCFQLNQHLAQLGFLEFDRGRVRRGDRQQRIARVAGQILAPTGLRTLVRRVKVGLEMRGKGPKAAILDQRIATQAVDWKRTRAAVMSRSDCGVHVAPATLGGPRPDGPEREEVIEELRAVLDALRDPVTGEPLVTWVGRREEVLSGPFTEQAPDLFLSLSGGEVQLSPALAGPLYDSDGWTGTHRLDGVLVAAGPGIQPGVAPPAHVMDITPTVLHSLGLAVPSYMDGQVLTGLFDDQWLDAHPVAAEDASDLAVTSPGSSSGSVQERAEAVERLRELGYL